MPNILISEDQLKLLVQKNEKIKFLKMKLIVIIKC